MQKKLLLFSLLLVSICSFFYVLAFIAPVQKLQSPSLSQATSELYQFSGGVYQSEKLGEFLESIVQERLECYSASPLARLSNCNTKYISSIVNTGRSNVESFPDMGTFIEKVRTCPVVYAICMGEFSNEEKCTDYEARCIDGIFDKYWRGTPLTKN